MKLNMYQRFMLAVLRTYIERTARTASDHHFVLIITTVIARGKVYEYDISKIRYFDQWLEAEEARIAEKEARIAEKEARWKEEARIAREEGE